jgi:hypothetical protein
VNYFNKRYSLAQFTNNFFKKNGLIPVFNLYIKKYLLVFEKNLAFPSIKFRFETTRVYKREQG